MARGATSVQIRNPADNAKSGSFSTIRAFH